MDQNGKDDLKTQFVTREGTYRLTTLSEYSRPNRVGYQSNQNNPQVRVSLLPAKSTGDGAKLQSTGSTAAASTTSTNSLTSNKYMLQQSSTVTTSSAPGTSMSNGISDISMSSQQLQNLSDKICFNFGKELYVYSYRGLKKNVDLCKPIDKKLYKGTSPSCHDFNETTAACDCAPLLVGFSTGQIQLVQPGKRETGRLFNEERLIDKTKVTCLKWLPKSPNLFLASHSSGHLYLYNEELPCSPAAPNYQNFKTGDGYTILTCKSKSTRNPLYKWTFNTENSSINEFCFSPCGTMLAIVSQDGFLRAFHYDSMELLEIARSYFGGFLCVCWSPDSKYIVVGGEDDLVTIWSVHERQVVARGQGHRSWVSVVSFDPFTSYSHCDSPDLSDEENPNNTDKPKLVQTNETDGNVPLNNVRTTRHSYRNSLTTEKIGTCYRLGSVGQDTQLCLWDITEDTLRQSYEKRNRLGSLEPQSDTSIPVKETSSSKSPAETDNNSNNKISNFRTKFAAISNSKTNDDSGSSNNISHATNNLDKWKHSNTNNVSKLNKVTNVMENCVNTTSNNVSKNDLAIHPSDETSSSKSNNGSGLNPFNTLTQRLSQLNFVNDKKLSSNQHSHKKSFPFSKASGNHNTSNFGINQNRNESDGSSITKNSKNLNNVSYDPMKLIGSAACPRFDECPLLEPLVCKKIAHERLTALIFREDCFLTACQDGFIYTWARPGYSNIPQHNLSNSPTGTASGTVV